MWYKLFPEGREILEDDECCRRSSTSKTGENMFQVKNLLNSDCRMSFQITADDLRIPQAFEILTENLAIRKVVAKLVPPLFSKE